MRRDGVVQPKTNSRTQFFDRCVQFLNLAFSQARSSIHTVAILDQLPNGLHPRCLG